MTNFATRLHDAVRRTRTPALVGLDPRFDRLPKPCITAAEGGFLVSVEAEDPKFAERDTVELLKSAGATHVELIIG